MVFNATFNNISGIAWRSVLLVEKIGVPGGNNRSAKSHRLLNQRTLYDQTIFKGGVHLFFSLANSAEYDCVVSIKSASHSSSMHVTIQVTTFPAICFYWGVCTNPGHYSDSMVFSGFIFYFFWLVFSMILDYCRCRHFFILFFLKKIFPSFHTNLLSLSDPEKLGRLDGS